MKIFIFCIFALMIFNQKSFGKTIDIQCEVKERCDKGKKGKLYLNDSKYSGKIAILLFLPGGEGNYGNKMPDYFKYLKKELSIAIMNPGYNMPNTMGDPPLRYSNDYQEKIRSSILYLKKNYNKPVWLIGHSAGGPGVAGFLQKNIKSEDYLSGVIFSGANIRSHSGNQKKNLPILIIHHKDDRCHSNYYYGAVMKLEKYKKINNSVTELVTMEGGGPFGDDPCGGRNNRHAFKGKEKEYAEAVLQFIKENTK